MVVCPCPSVTPILSTRAGRILGQEPCNIPRLGAQGSQAGRGPRPLCPTALAALAGAGRRGLEGRCWEGVGSRAPLPLRGRLGELKMAAAARRGALGPARTERTH